MEENILKTKQEILTALAHSGDDKLLLAGLLDKEQTCEQRGYLTHTKFLDLKQRALCCWSRSITRRSASGSPNSAS